MKNLNIKTVKQLSILSLMLLTISCSDNECSFGNECIESCELFTDFETETINTSGNWQGMALNANGVRFVSRSSSIVLEANDGSGASYAYNNVDFPSNLIQAGCELQFDIEYNSGNVNGALARNTIIIYDGATPTTSANSARFLLNTSNGVLTGTGFQTISVPLELASGTTLPSNSFGEWIINGVVNSTPPNSSDIADFNTLIQNIAGLAFYLDVTTGTPPVSGPTEVWWFDNFCFKQCCP